MNVVCEFEENGYIFFKGFYDVVEDIVFIQEIVCQIIVYVVI